MCMWFWHYCKFHLSLFFTFELSQFYANLKSLGGLRVGVGGGGGGGGGHIGLGLFARPSVRLSAVSVNTCLRKSI